MGTRLRFVCATLVAFLVATLLWVAPLLPVLRTGYLQQFPDLAALARADAYLTSWMLAWGAHALRTEPLHVYHANIFHPLPWTFAFSENLLAGALLVMPVDLAFRSPTLDNNVLLIASFVLLGTGTTLLVRELGAGWPAAVLAGVIVAFNPLRFRTIGHVQSLSSHWMPFALLAIHRCLRRGRGGVAVAVTVLLVSLSSVYYAYFFLIALAVFVPVHWLVGGAAAPGGRARALAGIAVAATLTAVVLLPYMIARDMYALGRDTGDAWFMAARLQNYFGVVADPFGYLRQRYVAREDGLWLLGLGTIALATIGLVAGAPRGGRRTSVLYLLTGSALAVVSMGPYVEWRPLSGRDLPGVWPLLSRVVPGFAALRVSMRAATVAVLATGILAGLGADALWRRARQPSSRRLVLAIFAGIALLEAWRPAFTMLHAPWTIGVPPVYRWLARQPDGGAVVDMPIGGIVTDAAAMVMSATHWKPLVNGYSGFSPTMSYFRALMAGFPSPSSITVLHDVGVRWIVLHRLQLPRAQAAWCDAEPAAVPAELRLVYRDATECAFEIVNAPDTPPPPPDRAVSLAGATVTTSAGTDAAAAHDDRLETHWIEAIDPQKESWLQIDLPAPHHITRVVVELGSHFGEFLRRWRLDTSLDGTTWTTAGAELNGTPPLVGLRRTPERLVQELRLTAPTAARHLRIVRPANDNQPGTIDAWFGWTRWGVHELRVFEAAP